jgi:hypothetical protein
VCLEHTWQAQSVAFDQCRWPAQGVLQGGKVARSKDDKRGAARSETAAA